MDVNFLIYADDVKLFCEIKNLSDCKTLQQNLNRVNAWCKNNYLTLNVSKCNIMTFTKKLDPLKYDYRLDNTILTRPNTIKDLGVLFDPKLTFIPHLTSLISSCYKTLGFILRNMKDLKKIETCKLLFRSLVISKLEYACIVWSPIYITHVTNLENIQRRFLKSLHYQFFGTYPPRGFPESHLLTIFEMQSLHERRQIHLLVYLHKLLGNRVNSPELIERINIHIPRMTSRYSQTFSLPLVRTNALRQSPLHQMQLTYNTCACAVDIFNCRQSDFKNIFAHSNL